MTHLPILRGALRGKQWLIATRSSFFFGTYETEQTRAFLAAVQPADVVYDLGAHCGYYTLLASLAAPKGHIFAFEPSRRNLICLHRHLALNGRRNVTVLDMAIGHTTELGGFEDHIGSGIGCLSAKGQAKVLIASLDALAHLLPPPQIIKIDVEGAELQVLNGAAALIAKYMPRIFLSTHSDCLWKQCSAFLFDFGYRIKPMGLGSCRRWRRSIENGCARGGEQAARRVHVDECYPLIANFCSLLQKRTP